MLRPLLPLLLLALPLFAADPKPAPPADLTTPPADGVKAENGLVTKQLAAGVGVVKPTDEDLVKVRYTVWKADGTLVQHVPAPRSATLMVTKMIPGWAEAVKQMVPGERQRAWVPASLNGGKLDQGLVFDTELLEIVEAPRTPEDVAAPPADATKTESGLAYKVLRPGTGTGHPKGRSTVVVHYTGWTTDGRLFDSSVLRGEPATFPLDAVIRGWTEGLQLMVPGEKTRFWIPAKLAYGNDKSKPQGMLVFDIELVAVK
jgi:FKBP-type peptidyl-prolyl cis-trans isomerase